jgi:hypothetical protein
MNRPRAALDTSRTPDFVQGAGHVAHGLQRRSDGRAILGQDPGRLVEAGRDLIEQHQQLGHRTGGVSSRELLAQAKRCGIHFVQNAAQL